jgi:hypothetical protein
MLSSMGIATPKEFLKAIVDPDMAEFSGAITDLRVAHHACISLLSLRDWVAKAHDGTTWTYRGRIIGTIDVDRPAKGFGADLIGIERQFEVIFDIANASKHMVLGNRKLTELHGSANVAIQILSSESTTKLSPTTSPEEKGELRVLVKIGNDHHDVLKCAQAVHAAWADLFRENGW